MKIYCNFNRYYKLIHGDCIDLLKLQKENKVSTIVADWPFKEYKKLLTNVVTESKRVLNDGGTFISVHYNDENFYVRKECEDIGLIFGDEIILQNKVSYKINKNKLPRRTISILAMIKGSLDNRQWNIDSSKIPNIIFDATSMNIPTTFWGDKIFKNGYKNNLIGKHSQAMPKWVVEKMFDTLIPPNGNILDLFGGSGNILINAMKRNIPCKTIEIEKSYCEMIINRLLHEESKYE